MAENEFKKEDMKRKADQQMLRQKKKILLDEYQQLKTKIMASIGPNASEKEFAKAIEVGVFCNI